MVDLNTYHVLHCNCLLSLAYLVSDRGKSSAAVVETDDHYYSCKQKVRYKRKV